MKSIRKPMKQIISYFCLSIIFFVSFSQSRPSTCNHFIDKYAPDHAFMTGYLDPGFQDDITGLGFVFYSKRFAFTAEEIASSPTLIWLNGGPGSSSMEGAYFENGPYRVVNVNNTAVIESNPGAWTNKYNVLFIDQPIAVGFSRSINDTQLPRNETEVAAQFYNAIQSFYTGNGCYNSSIFLKSPLFITGESYCGKYIPNMAQEILQQNEINSVSESNEKVIIPLFGVSIGDPLIDPQHQLDQLAEYGTVNNLISDQTRIVVQSKIATMKAAFSQNQNELASSLYDEAISYFMENSINHLKNVYNFKIGPYPDDFIYHHCENYIKQFGFDQDFQYSSTSNKISNSLHYDLFQPNGIPALQYLLSQNFQVLIYNGDNDILINTLGVNKFINNFEWRGKEEFSNTPMKNFTNDNHKIIGQYKSYQSLHYATIADAGHLVPFDQPENCSLLIDSFISYVLSQQKNTQTKSS